MSNTRNLSNLLDSNGDVKATHLDNAPTPTKSEIEGLGIAASSLTGALPAISGANLTGILTAVTLDSPSISGTLSVDSGSNVTHTIGNWSEELNYTITPTNCTVGSINASGEFIVTHTSGVPSYTIKATTDNLGLDDSSLVTKNLVVKLTAPTISSPADTTVTTNVVYTVTSTDSGDDKIILDMGTSNFTYQSVDVGSGSKVGNTVEVTGFTTGNPAITVQFTALGTYADVKAKSTNIAGTYGDSDYSSTDSILIYEQLSAPSLNAPADTNDTTAVTYTISSINANSTKVIFDAQSSNFTYGSVGSGTGTKVGNTVEITGWSGTSVTVTLTYTTAATYTNRAKVTNTADATYTDSAWSSTDSIVISSSFTFQGSSKGFTHGGCCDYLNHIDNFSFSSSSSTADWGDLSAGKQTCSGMGSSTQGYTCGGKTSSSVITSVIERFNYASSSSSSTWSNLSSSRQGTAGHSSGSEGFVSGGYTTGAVSTVDKFSFTSSSTATSITSLSVARRMLAGSSSTTHAYVAGGLTSSQVNVIDRYSFSASGGTATDWGNLATARHSVPGISSSTHGFSAGGYAGGYNNVIDRYSFASSGNATSWGSISPAKWSPAGHSGEDYGFVSAGSSNGSVTNDVDRFSYASSSSVSSWGSIYRNRRDHVGTQY